MQPVLQHLESLKSEFIQYWKVFISDNLLQRFLDFLGTSRSPYHKRIWYVLLEEKLRRHEQEVFIPDQVES